VLYNLFRYILWVMYRAYFHRIECIGFDKIPKDKAVIFISNHANGLMDPIIPAALHRRPVWFWGRIEEFPNNLKGKFMRTMHGLPIYRRQNGVELMKRNNTTFDASKNKLDQGDTIYLAPEGTCVIHRKLLPFKTGCARFSFDYAFQEGPDKELYIVPIALTYSSWNQVKGSVTVEMLDPVDVGDYKAIYQKDEESAVRSLTNHLRETIKKGMVYVEHDTHEETILDYVNILMNEMEASQVGYTTEGSVHEVLKQKAKEMMSWPVERLEALKTTVDSYKAGLKEAGLTDIKLSLLDMGVSRHINYVLAMLLGIGGLVPNKLTGYLLKKLNPIPVFGTSYCFTIAFFVWGLWSLLLFAALSWFDMILAISIPCLIIILTILSMDLRYKMGPHSEIKTWHLSNDKAVLLHQKKELIKTYSNIIV
jgi:1-acyl-sn-glycerol-3-phosphate acyltransferase